MPDERRELLEIETGIEHALATVVALLHANARHTAETAATMEEILQTFTRTKQAKADLHKQMTDLDTEMT